MNQISFRSIFAGCCCLLLPLLSSAQTSPAPEENEAVVMIKQIYKEVSSDGTALPDWDMVRPFFVDEAVIVLRSSREGSTQFTLEEFIQDFKDFYQSPAMKDSGFKESVLQVKDFIYYDIALIGVVYEAKILDSERPATRGIDFWSLVRKDNSWKAVSVTNEVIRPGETLPPPFD